MKYIALIGDIVSSKQIIGRIDFQNNLDNLFKRLNTRNPHIVSPYTITIGDEFQVLYGSATGIFADALTIILHIHPVKLRLAYGFGSITTDINPQKALGMDGPAFHLARSGILIMKEEESKHKQVPRMQLISEDNLPFEDILKTALSLVALRMATYSKNQLVILLNLLESKTIKQTAQDLNISEQAIYRAIRRDSLNETADFFLAVETALNREL